MCCKQCDSEHIEARGLCTKHYNEWRQANRDQVRSYKPRSNHKQPRFRAEDGLSGTTIGLIKVLEEAGEGLMRCVCTNCGQIFKRARRKLLDARLGRAKRSCGECGVSSRIGGDEPESQIRRRIVGKAYHSYKSGARSRSRPVAFDISKSHIQNLVFRPCTYCGELDKELQGVSYCGIDRVDSAKGYLPGNLVPCCHKCNRSKGEKTLLEWVGTSDVGYFPTSSGIVP